MDLVNFEDDGFQVQETIENEKDVSNADDVNVERASINDPNKSLRSSERIVKAKAQAEVFKFVILNMYSFNSIACFERDSLY